VPFLFKYAVDAVNDANTAIGSAVGDGAPVVAAALFSVTGLIASYGVARATASGFNELRNAVFARVAQDSIRRVAKKLYSCTCTALICIFNVAPTALRGVPSNRHSVYKCGPAYAGVAIASIASYALSHSASPMARTKFRQQMNKADNVGWQSRLLIAGAELGIEPAIFSAGLSSCNVLAASDIAAGSLTIGDLVYVLCKQLRAPNSDYDAADEAKPKLNARWSQIEPKWNFAMLTLATFRLHCALRQEGALVGGSGSGKSTIVRLLYASLRAQSGSILINGDCVLFKTTPFVTIYTNGDLSATPEQVEGRCPPSRSFTIQLCECRDSTILLLASGDSSLAVERNNE
uniref:ABC transporter domain-containing protein n=1 Tax=Macrostomum lignano TaxID=282301 RepID=A0A1I8FLS5_9PLAT